MKKKFAFIYSNVRQMSFVVILREEVIGDIGTGDCSPIFSLIRFCAYDSESGIRILTVKAKDNQRDFFGRSLLGICVNYRCLMVELLFIRILLH